MNSIIAQLDDVHLIYHEPRGETDNKYMMDALKAAPKDQVTLELSSPITPCIIVPAEGEENFLFMVLPVRLKADF